MKYAALLILCAAIAAAAYFFTRVETPAPAATTPAAASKAKPYPLDTCIVSDEKLGGMGDPFLIVHEGQEFKLCCDNCKPDFDKDPAKFVAKLAAASIKK